MFSSVTQQMQSVATCLRGRWTMVPEKMGENDGKNPIAC